MKLSMKILLLSAIGLASQSSLVAGQVVTHSYIDANNGERKEVVVDAGGDSGVPDPRVIEPVLIQPELVCGEGDESCKAPAEEEPVAAAEGPTVVAEEEKLDPKCPSRPHVVRCAAKYLDTDKNGALEREELDNAMKNVSWIVRGLLKVIGSTDSIMKKCDADGDGKITIEHDMEATKETCLATCFKRKAFKQLFFPDCAE